MLKRHLSLNGRTDRKTYVLVGVALMVLKFAVEAVLGHTMTGQWPSPLVYFAPFISLRNQLLGPDPSARMVMGLIAWTLPFAWIGIAFSVRRARDAGLPVWMGLGFLIPVFNYVAIALLAIRPTKALAPGMAEADVVKREIDDPNEPYPPTQSAGRIRAALFGVFGGAIFLVVVVGIGASIYGEYGGGVFLGAPFLTGAIAGFVYCRESRRSERDVWVIGVVTQLVGGLLLLLFAAEGVICLAMAMPLVCAAGAIGALLGQVIAGAPKNRIKHALFVPILTLPLMVVGTPAQPTLRVVETEVTVNAPPEDVWKLVIAFPEIPSDTASSLLFRAGVAMPLRARIVGTGVGAVRHCEFTTGAFVEPVTVWNPPYHLAFDVTDQPEPMAEMSFWKHVHAPHLVDGTLRSERGEFRLERLPGNRTRLIGRTWYRVDMGPETYWATWVDVVVHQVHRRVLGHIANVAHANRAATTVGGVATP